MWLSWLVVATAWGAPPAPDLRFGVWPGGFLSAFVTHQTAAGETGLALEPLCREAAPDLQLCVTVHQGDEARPVHLQDLETWGLTPKAARAQALASARAVFATKVVRNELEGLGPWFLRNEADGFDGAALLLPELLEETVGGGVVLGIPAEGAALFWAHGQADRDRAIAIGVRRAAEAAEQPVSDHLYRWDGKKWVVWARAEKAPPSP